MVVRIRAKNPRGSREYFEEPYTVQHFTDWLTQLGTDAWHVVLLLISKRRRMDMARAHNQAIFGNIPTNQIYVLGKDGVRPLREEERTWPE